MQHKHGNLSVTTSMGQLNVVGYDEFNLEGSLLTPITFIHQLVHGICRFAAESIIDFSSWPLPSPTVFPIRLVELKSTDCAAFP